MAVCGSKQNEERVFFGWFPPLDNAQAGIKKGIRIRIPQSSSQQQTTILGEHRPVRLLCPCVLLLTGIEGPIVDQQVVLGPPMCVLLLLCQDNQSGPGHHTQ